MSWYYTYYIGYEKDNKIYPLGPYDAGGKLFDIMSKSRSFASDLHQRFKRITEEMVSDEFRKEFEYKYTDGQTILDLPYLSYLPLDELPVGDPVKYGYALSADVQRYMKENAAEDGDPYWVLDELKYNMLTTEEFAVKAQQELLYGAPTPEVDCEGEELPAHSCKEYCFFSYCDTGSEIYEASEIRKSANVFEFSELIFDRKKWEQKYKIVVILQQG